MNLKIAYAASVAVLVIALAGTGTASASTPATTDVALPVSAPASVTPSAPTLKVAEIEFGFDLLSDDDWDDDWDDEDDDDGDDDDEDDGIEFETGVEIEFEF